MGFQNKNKDQRFEVKAKCARIRLETYKSSVIRLTERLVECGHVDASEFLCLMQSG
jgi:hypothetical protein